MFLQQRKKNQKCSL